MKIKMDRYYLDGGTEINLAGNHPENPRECNIPRIVLWLARLIQRLDSYRYQVILHYYNKGVEIPNTWYDDAMKSSKERYTGRLGKLYDDDNDNMLD